MISIGCQRGLKQKENYKISTTEFSEYLVNHNGRLIQITKKQGQDISVFNESTILQKKV